MRILATIMAVVLVFSSMVWAAGPAFVGNLRSSGVVLTNSIPMPDGGTVRSGDVVTTQSGALAVILSASHGRLEVRANSEARLIGDHLRLERGSVAASRMAVEAGGYTIRAENPTVAWFAVANRGGRLVVAAHHGNVVIASAGEPPVVVNEGSVAQQEQAPANSQPDQDQPEQQKKKKRAAGAAAGGWTIGSLSHAASVALVVGVGAAVAGTAAGLAVSLNEAGPSPSR